MSALGPIEAYEEHDALGLAALVRSGEVSPTELLECAIARTEAWNPQLNAVVLRLFDEAHAAIASGPPEGPFHGVPYLLKDLGLQLTGSVTTGGSQFFKDAIASQDSELVRRYRDAGFVIFGKSAAPEFGITTTTESTLHGATRNPWSPDHTSGGSSGGASAAVASGILPLANASDGGGSIRIPASCCGLFGLKPTRGRVPSGPMRGEGWAGMSTAHAISRSVRDSAALLDASHGPELGSPYFAPPVERPFLDEVGAPPGRLRIALQTESFNGATTHPDCVEAAWGAARLCEALGHEVQTARLEVDVQAIGIASQVIISANLLHDVDERAARLEREPSKDELEPFTQIMLEGGRIRTAADYVGAVEVLHGVGREVATFLQDFDLLLTPSLATPPLEIGALSLSNPDLIQLTQNMLACSGYTQLFNLAGSPAMSVPLHWSESGLPIGVQFASRFGDEATLFRLAAQLEEARPWFGRRPPRP